MPPQAADMEGQGQPGSSTSSTGSTGHGSSSSTDNGSSSDELILRLQKMARSTDRLSTSDLLVCPATLASLLGSAQCCGPGQGCACRMVPLLAHLLEQLQDEVRSVADVLESELHRSLPALAAALLSGGHSTRAFRRTTEAYEM